jgi:hypothetical protein
VIVPGAAPVHLTYCSNIHPGESWAQVRANLEHHVVRVARALGGPTPFGVGLRLSNLAARELADPAAMAELREFLAAQRLYVFTLNGFPYGTFHGVRVKEEVYLPDWTQPERLAYSERLAELLAQLLPEALCGGELDGSVSSVPGAFRERVRGRADVERMAEALITHAASLHALRERSGRAIALALEPEPRCYLETLEEAARFFREELLCAAAVRRMSALTGLGAAAAQAALRRHLTLCLDACHAAVQFEDLQSGLALLADAGVRVSKLQLSAGLSVRGVGAELPDAELEKLLAPFADPVYLHQVVARGPGGLRRWLDLPEALRGHRERGAARPEEWRVHFHVPIFLEQFDPAGRLRSTQPFLAELLAHQARAPIAPQLEVETYTWNVLPAEHRAQDVARAIERELRWVLERLAA